MLVEIKAIGIAPVLLLLNNLLCNSPSPKILKMMPKKEKSSYLKRLSLISKKTRS
jgi:hypothetical protein